MINFDVSVVNEHGYSHYKIIDMNDGNEVHCDLNELSKTIEELLEEKVVH